MRSLFNAATASMPLPTPPINRPIALLLPEHTEFAARIAEGVARYAAAHECPRIVELPLDDSRLQTQFLKTFAGVLALTQGSRVAAFADRAPCPVEWIFDASPAELAGNYISALQRLPFLVGRRLIFVDDHSAWSGNELIVRIRESPIFVGRLTIRSQGNPWWTPESEDEELLAGLGRAMHSNPPACLVFGNSLNAVAVQRWMESNPAAAPPRPVRLLSLLDDRICKLSRISAIDLPLEQLGNAAAEALVERLRGQTGRRQKSALKLTLRERDSTLPEGRLSNAQRAYEMIDALACSGLSVQDVLREIGVSQKTLNKMFRQAYGVTVGRRIRDVKINRAKGLLQETRMTVGEVTEHCGFGSTARFCVTFKNEVGMTPSDFRVQQSER